MRGRPIKMIQTPFLTLKVRLLAPYTSLCIVTDSQLMMCYICNNLL